MFKRLPVVLLFLVLASLVSLSGCASVKQYVNLPDQNTALEDLHKARIYVMRPAVFGSAIPMTVKDNGMLIGKTGPHSFICWEREPGITVLTGEAENSSQLELAVEEGMTYYVCQHVRMGFFIARNKLEEVTREKGISILEQCKPPFVIANDNISQKE